MRWIKGLLAVIGGIVVLVVAAAVAVGVLTRERLPDQVVLVLDLEAPVIEAIPDDVFGRAMVGDRWRLQDLIEALERAAADDRVLGLIARVGDGDHGIAAVQEIRQAVQRFRAAGKPALAFAETMGEAGPGNQGYYLASAFERIYLQESGDVGLVGLSSESPFLRETLARLDLEPRLDARERYKTVINHATETGLTEAHREADQALLDDLFNTLLADIAEARGLEVEPLRELIDRGPFFGAEAVAAGLVDGLAYRDQVDAALRAEVGEFAAVDGRRYLRLAEPPRQRGAGVAVIHGSGPVTRGDSSFSPVFGGSTMGADSINAAFAAAIADDDIAAILFRIDSPGGSYVASDAIWRMTQLAREAGKPVVASMGNAAASGGYFVAMGADRIIAQPGTLTGSIGVAGGKLVTDRFWQERLGVHWETLTTSANATMYSFLHDYTEYGWQRHEEWLDRIYDDFVAKAAQGRQLPTGELDALARGRVWTGRQALEHGLVDAVGGYAEARVALRELLQLEADAPLRLVPYPQPRGWLELLSAGNLGAAATRAGDALGPVLRALPGGAAGPLEMSPREIR